MVTTRRPTHPGIVLREDVIEPLGISVTAAAALLGVTRKTLSLLLNGHASVSPTMALRIAAATKTTPESWLTMQARYDLWMARQSSPSVKPFPRVVNE